jgi:hypothetical protein
MFTRKPASSARPPVAAVRHLFHGIAVRPCDEFQCDAVKALGEQRFLSDDAPRLPLEDCSQPGRCGCVYKHFNDRRTTLRRESDVGLPNRPYELDRRVHAPRRITDE